MKNRGGFWCVGSVLRTAETRRLLRQLDHYIQNPRTYENALEFEYESNGVSVRKMRRLPWLELEPWSMLWHNETVQRLLASRFDEAVRIAYCAAFLKPARVGSRTPFHQDQVLWTRELPGAISCWMALDRADEENGCLVLCPNSHLQGRLSHDEPAGGGHPEVERSILESFSKESVPLDSGSAVAWDRLLVHGSWENRSGRARRGIVTVFAPSRFLTEADPLAWSPKPAYLH